MIHLDKVSARHGRQLLLVDASLAVFAGERVGLVGPNGSGKSTILRLIVGEERPDGGQVSTDRGVAIGYFSQDVGELSGRTVLAETVGGAGEVAEIARELGELEQEMADPARVDELETIVARYGEVQARFELLGGYSIEARARAILAGLGFRPEVVDDDTAKLSGGWKMRVALARILLMRPEVLLLDEPTNHLDLESIIWLEQFLLDFEGALIITSHDRAFLNRVVTRVVEIDGGELRNFSGNYDFYEAQRDLLETQVEAQVARQQAMLAKEHAFIERFKARASHAAQVQSRQKKIDKIDLVEPRRRRKVPRFIFRAPPRSGEDVVKLAGVHKRYGELQVYRGFELLVRRGERWCVLGVNGAGKSTLLKLVVGATAPDAGSVTLGASVKVGYFAQHTMEQLEPTLTVVETLQQAFPTAGLGNLLTLAGAFGFSGDEVEKSCRVLSGGEKARLVIARMLYEPPNFLVLDEPTNHLDLESKKMLVASLEAFEGTMLFVSHDRAFLHALSNRVLELDAGEARQYGGGYSEYVQRSGHEAPGVPARQG